MSAWSRRNSQGLLELLETGGIQPNILFERGRSRRKPLSSACVAGAKEVAELMLNFAKENNFISEILFGKDYYGRTPLHWACKECRKEVSEFILNLARYNNCQDVRSPVVRSFINWNSPLFTEV